MADIMTLIERTQELSGLLLKMCQELNNLDDKKFWDLQQEFDSLIAINKLEDEINSQCKENIIKKKNC